MSTNKNDSILISIEKELSVLSSSIFEDYQNKIISYITEEFCFGSIWVLLSEDANPNSEPKLYSSGVYYEIEDYSTLEDFFTKHYSGNKTINGNKFFFNLFIDEIYNFVSIYTSDWNEVLFNKLRTENNLLELYSFESFSNEFNDFIDGILYYLLIEPICSMDFKEALNMGVSFFSNDKIESLECSASCKELLYLFLNFKNDLLITISGVDFEPISFKLHDEAFYLLKDFRNHSLVKSLGDKFNFLDEYILRCALTSILPSEGSIIIREFTNLSIDKEGKKLQIHKIFGIITYDYNFSHVDKKNLEFSYDGVSTPNEKMVFCSLENN